MAYVKTDATYYGKNAKTVDVEASPVPYNISGLDHAKVALVHDSTGHIIVNNTIVRLAGTNGDFVNKIKIYPSDPRGTYYVQVTWYKKNKIPLHSEKSKFIYLT